MQGNNIGYMDMPLKRKRAGKHSDKKEKVKRLEVQVREPGTIAPFVVVGMLVACFLLMFALTQYAKMVELNNTAAGYRRQLNSLEIEEAKLLARYELAYDLQAIETDVLESGEMVKLQNSQIYVIELAEPDAVNYYEKDGLVNEIASEVGEFFSSIETYF